MGAFRSAPAAMRAGRSGFARNLVPKATASKRPAATPSCVDDLLPLGRLRVVGDAGLAVERDRVVGDGRELRDDETGRRALDVVLLHQVVRQIGAKVRAATRERRLRV